MRWVSNGPTCDPNVEHGNLGLLFSRTITIQGVTTEVPCCCMLIGMTVGEPKATERFTIEELKTAGLVGYYAKDE